MIAAAIVVAALILGLAWKYHTDHNDKRAAETDRRERALADSREDFDTEQAESVDALMASTATRKVVVTLMDGEAFDGIVESCDSQTVQLQRARQILSNEASPVPVDGVLLIPRRDIRYLQRP